MKPIVTAGDIKRLGTILSVWAHPDDESYSCAGIMTTAVDNGQKVICVTATKGESGVQDANRWPAEKLGEIRAGELANALKILGVRTHHWLDYQDGCCCDVPEKTGGEQLKKLIRQYKPDTILTFGPDGWTGHSDHCSVSCWVDCATEDIDVAVYHWVIETSAYETHLKIADEQFNIFFNIDELPLKHSGECDISYKLSPAVLKKKRAALMAMPSQTEVIFKNSSPETINTMLGHECFVLSK